MAKIRYIGKKPTKEDNVARTGAVWNGRGDVQDVPDSAVGKLLAHPGVWERVDGDTPAEPVANVAAINEGSGGEDIALGDDGADGTDDNQESDLPPLVDLNSMDGDKLREYAQQHYGHVFHHKTGDQKMRDTIVGLMNRG